MSCPAPFSNVPSHKSQVSWASLSTQLHRPSPVSLQVWDGPFYFGVELEIDEAGENSDNIHRLPTITNQGQPQLSMAFICAGRSGALLTCSGSEWRAAGPVSMHHQMSLSGKETTFPSVRWSRIFSFAFVHQTGVDN